MTIMILPQGAVQILGIIQEILPEVAQLNTLSPPPLPTPEVPPENGTTSQHYAIVESDHPYKPASVFNYKVCTKL
jgi:E3 ubiquitin-protein ligase MYCBP2